jgi:WD40 repeat protein
LIPPSEGISFHSFFVFSPDGSQIASLHHEHEGVITLWDVSTGRELMTLAGHSDQIWSCTFSADGSRIVSGSADGTVKIWEAAVVTELGRPVGHTDKVSTCTFSPQGSRITGSDNGTLKLWDSKSGRAGDLGPKSEQQDRAAKQNRVCER